jgi:hypothetical protein
LLAHNVSIWGYLREIERYDEILSKDLSTSPKSFLYVSVQLAYNL